MPEGLQPKGVTPRLRSGAVAKSARLRWCSNGREELPCFRGQGRWLGGATRGVVAAQAQEGLEELSHVEGQEGQR